MDVMQTNVHKQTVTIDPDGYAEVKPRTHPHSN